MRIRLTKAHSAVLVVALLFLGCGCGRGTAEVDTGPFATAIQQYLQEHSMGLKISEFRDLKVSGDTAEATVSLEHAEDMVGVKVRWQFWFARQDGAWTVSRYRQ